MANKLQIFQSDTASPYQSWLSTKQRFQEFAIQETLSTATVSEHISDQETQPCSSLSVAIVLQQP
jgi:hypothetical protein